LSSQSDLLLTNRQKPVFCLFGDLATAADERAIFLPLTYFLCAEVAGRHLGFDCSKRRLLAAGVDGEIIRLRKGKQKTRNFESDVKSTFSPL